MRIENSIALVTGGGSGLGAATAERLASCGAKVAILDFNLEAAQQQAERIGGHAVKTDVSDESSVAEAMERIGDHFGSAARIVVNCAGVGLAARIVGREGKLASDVFERTMRVNLFGTYYVMSHAARAMMAEESDPEADRGVIVNTSSVAWQDGQLGQAAYAASKGAIAAMCLPAAREFARANIRVLAIAPGLFHTPMMDGLSEEVARQIAANIPYPARLGAPEEFAITVQQLIENPYVNGTTLRLDGAVRLPQR